MFRIITFSNNSGVRKDRNDVHFFHTTSNAYATGQRKRRKIETEDSPSIEHFRWHKTGKNKAVIENGVHKGWKKIFSLYRSSKKGSKPEKSNWVIHQYHLGTDEDEKEGEYVLSKISYQQPKQSSKSNENVLIENFDVTPHQTSPRTPKSNPPVPPRPGKSHAFNAVADNAMPQSFAKVASLLRHLILAFTLKKCSSVKCSLKYALLIRKRSRLRRHLFLLVLTFRRRTIWDTRHGWLENPRV